MIFILLRGARVFFGGREGGGVGVLIIPDYVPFWWTI